MCYRRHRATPSNDGPKAFGHNQGVGTSECGILSAEAFSLFPDELVLFAESFEFSIVVVLSACNQHHLAWREVAWVDASASASRGVRATVAVWHAPAAPEPRALETLTSNAPTTLINFETYGVAALCCEEWSYSSTYEVRD